MTALLRAELIKLRTTRTFLALAGLAVASSLLVAGLVAALSEPTRDSVLADVFASDTTGLFILVLAIVGIGGEWRHRTITSSLLAAPDRVRFLAAKSLAFAAAGLVLSIAVGIAVAVLGLAVLSARGLPTPPLDEIALQAGRSAVVSALLGAFGVGIGALVRNQVVAIVGLLLVMFVAEPLLLAFAPEVGRFSPLGALVPAAQGLSADDVAAGDVEFLPTGLALAALLAWIAAAFAAGASLLRRRDLV